MEDVKAAQANAKKNKAADKKPDKKKTEKKTIVRNQNTAMGQALAAAMGAVKLENNDNADVVRNSRRFTVIAAKSFKQKKLLPA